MPLLTSFLGVWTGALGPMETWMGTTFFCLDLLEFILETSFPMPPAFSTVGSWETWGEGR